MDNMARLAFEILTAIGTIGATVAALYLGLRDGWRRIDCVFVWDEPTMYQPILLVQNISRRVIVLESVNITYMRKCICNVNLLEDYSYRQNAIIEAGQLQKLRLEDMKLSLTTVEKSKKKHMLKVALKQRNGRKCVYKLRYSQSELYERLFGKRLFQDDYDIQTNSCG